MGVSHTLSIIKSTSYIFDTSFGYGRLISIYACFLTPEKGLVNLTIQHDVYYLWSVLRLGDGV